MIDAQVIQQLRDAAPNAMPVLALEGTMGVILIRNPIDCAAIDLTRMLIDPRASQLIFTGRNFALQ